MPRPPIRVLTYSFDFNNAIIVPIKSNSFRGLFRVSDIIAKANSKISAINVCRKRRDSRHLNQLLKNPEVVWFNKHNIAKGDSKTRTFIIIYLKAKLIIRVKDETESIPERIPFIENILKLFVDARLKLFIKFEKDASVPNMFFPSEQIKLVISDVAETVYVHIVSEKFIKTATKNVFKRN